MALTSIAHRLGTCRSATSVRRGGPAASDLVIEGGRIVAVRPHDPGAAATADVEGRGRIAVPSSSEVHVHLDSTRIGLPFREHPGTSGVWGLMMNDRTSWRNSEIPVPTWWRAPSSG